MNNDNVKLTNEDQEFFGSLALMFIFAPLFWNKQDFPEELKIKVEELMNKGENIKDEDLNEIKPLIYEYYNKIKMEY